MKRTLILSVCLVRGLAAQSGPPVLAVHGLEPGISQSELREKVARIGGRLVCHPSTAEKRLAECAASITNAPDHRLWSLRASLVNGTAAIVIISATMPASDAERLRDGWSETFGRPNLKKEPALESYEWVGSGRTMRLTEHRAGNDRDVSVTLVDRAVLGALAKAP